MPLIFKSWLPLDVSSHAIFFHQAHVALKEREHVSLPEYTNLCQIPKEHKGSGLLLARTRGVAELVLFDWKKKEAKDNKIPDMQLSVVLIYL